LALALCGARERWAVQPPRRRLPSLPRLPRLAGTVDARGLSHLAPLDADDRRRLALPEGRDPLERRDPARAELLEAAAVNRVRPRAIASTPWPRRPSCWARARRA